ncbi:MAG: hypothetical protein NVS4B3_13480 [Gemmatimonadaceae bacterium]
MNCIIPRLHGGLRLGWALATAMGVAAASVDGQSPGVTGRRHEVAGAFLPPSHWAVAAVRRLAALGLTDREFGWGDASLTTDAIAGALSDAAANAPDRNPALAALADGFRDRFAHEFPTMVAALATEDASPMATRGDGTLELTSETRRGVLLPGGTAGGPPNNKLGHATVFLDDATQPAARAFWTSALVPHVGVALSPVYADASWRASAGHALGRWGAAGVWAGRRAVSYEPGVSSGIALSGAVPLNALGGALLRPIRLPWVLGRLGPMRAESFLSQLDSNGAIRHPYFTSTRISFAPATAVLLGVTHAAMFSGDGLAPLSLTNFLCMIGQGHAQHCNGGTEYEVQMGTFDARIHAPGPVPATLYGEWGMNDNKTAWKEIPAVIAGVMIEALPGMPQLSLGFEHTLFHTPCATCTYYGTWYQHFTYRAGWAVDGTPLGHPLGGEGRESLLSAKWDDPANRRALDARVFTRLRGPANLFAPAHGGRSDGGSIRLEWGLAGGMDALLGAEREIGNQWHQTRLSIGVRTVQ